MPFLPPYASRELVAKRLPLIFPEGIPNRRYCTRELAASTVFAMLYIGAVEGLGRYLGPVHVYRMTAEQAALSDASRREEYARGVLTRNFQVPGVRWYADNTREPIRDETLRDGFVAIGAVIRREDLPTTSGKPRYALKKEFAALFDPALEGEMLERKIAAFQAAHLSPSALARVSIMQAGAAAIGAEVLVTFPNRESRRLAPGPSSIICRAVIEEFTRRFLEMPAVLWLSESGNKVAARDDELAAKIGLKIEPDRNLPDIILADLGPSEPLIVFVEVVATDGAMTARRQNALYRLTDQAGFKRWQVAFVTAYSDRESPGFRRTVSALAWDSFAWFASEPASVINLRSGNAGQTRLADLIKRT